MLGGGLRSLGWSSSYVAAVIRARPGYGLVLLAVAAVLAAVPTTLLGASLAVSVLAVVAATTAVWLVAVARTRRMASPPGLLQGVLDGLTTDRLLLRSPTRDDAASRLATVDDDVTRFNGWRPSDVSAFARQCRAPGLAVIPADVLLVDKLSGEPVGELQITVHDPVRRRCALGWWIRPRCRRQGYATEAVAAALTALDAAGLREVLVGTLATNTAVRLICERLGMIQTPVTPAALRLPDRRRVAPVWYFHRPGPHRPGPDRWAGTGHDDPAHRATATTLATTRPGPYPRPPPAVPVMAGGRRGGPRSRRWWGRWPRGFSW